MKISKLFGSKVRLVRKQNGLSQDGLAALTGLHRTYIGAVERGERNITLESANKIAIALNLPLSKLLEKD